MESLGTRRYPTLPHLAVWGGSIEIAGEEGKIELSGETGGFLLSSASIWADSVRIQLLDPGLGGIIRVRAGETMWMGHRHE